MSGGGSTSQTTHNSLPKWAVPYAQQLLGLGANEFFPGGKLGQMPADLNQQVAGMTPDQLQGMSMIQQAAGVSPITNLPANAMNPAMAPGGLVGGSKPATPIAGLNAPIPNSPQPIGTGNPPDPVPNPVTPPKKKGK